MRADTVEQVFVRRRAGRIELLLVLVSPAGERQREVLLTPTASPAEAIGIAADHLAGRGVRAARRVRVRLDSGGSLMDDAGLLRLFIGALAGAPHDKPRD